MPASLSVNLHSRLPNHGQLNGRKLAEIQFSQYLHGGTPPGLLGETEPASQSRSSICMDEGKNRNELLAATQPFHAQWRAAIILPTSYG